jgi:chondroitin 4-sulfotransferase 11
MYSNQYKCIFVHINKTGGTSINNALETSPESAFQHLSIKRILELKPECGSYFKFAFVRNPWDWIVSEFHFRKQKTCTIPSNEEFDVKSLERYFGCDSCSWAEMHYFKIGRVGTGYQKSFLYVDDKLAVDYVGRFERYAEHLGEICSVLGIDKRSVLARHENSTRHLPYQQYYNDETKEHVRRLFEEDIDTFKYAFS